MGQDSVKRVPDHTLRWVDYFLEMLAAEHHATSNTIVSYRSDIYDFLSFLQEEHYILETCSRKEIQAYLDNRKQHTISTLNRRISSLRSFFHFLVSESLLLRNPLTEIQGLKALRPLPHVLTEVEIEHFLMMCSNPKTPEDIRFYALLELLYATGLRVSELISLPLNSISQPSHPSELMCLHICGKGGHERVLPIHAKAYQTLLSYLAIRSYFSKCSSSKSESWMFPSSGISGHLTRQGFALMLKKKALDANIDPHKLSPHTIRHTFATHFLNRGADLIVIQKLLGHADITTTQIYTHVTPKHIYDIVTKHHPISKMKNI